MFSYFFNIKNNKLLKDVFENKLCPDDYEKKSLVQELSQS